MRGLRQPTRGLDPTRKIPSHLSTKQPYQANVACWLKPATFVARARYSD